MAFFDQISNELQEFMTKQAMFFTASAPIEGRVNLSPKGVDSFRCFDANNVGYLDFAGSGNETAAHLRENGRMTIMFCSFAKKPLILRLYGKGQVVGHHHPRWEEVCSRFPPLPAVRQVILLAVDSVQTSCGFGVPMYELVEERDTLQRWGEKKSLDEQKAYWRKKNMLSIDGLETGIFAAEPEA